MTHNGESSHVNNTEDYSPLLAPSLEQQIYMLEQELQEARTLLKHQNDEEIEDNRIAKILKVTLESQAQRKEEKISRRAFTFSHFERCSRLA